jgi:hypothetical protein
MDGLGRLVPDGELDGQRRVGLRHDDRLEARVSERRHRVLHHGTVTEQLGRLRPSQAFPLPAGEYRSNNVAHGPTLIS